MYYKPPVFTFFTNVDGTADRFSSANDPVLWSSYTLVDDDGIDSWSVFVSGDSKQSFFITVWKNRLFDSSTVQLNSTFTSSSYQIITTNGGWQIPDIS